MGCGCGGRSRARNLGPNLGNGAPPITPVIVPIPNINQQQPPAVNPQQPVIVPPVQGNPIVPRPGRSSIRLTP